MAEIFKRLVPKLSTSTIKGQNGVIGIVGGSHLYTGAPYFSAMAGLNMGADLVYVMCTPEASIPIKSYSPELIVLPCLNLNGEYDRECEHFVKRSDVVIVGPGLSRHRVLQEQAKEICTLAMQDGKPIIFDGDGIYLLESNPKLVCGYTKAFLTPNVREYSRLCAKLDINPEAKDSILDLCKAFDGVTVIKKGLQDVISDGITTKSYGDYKSPRRCGGQGDILSGILAVTTLWAQNSQIGATSIDAAMAACYAVRRTSFLCFQSFERSYVASDILGQLRGLFTNNAD